MTGSPIIGNLAVALGSLEYLISVNNVTAYAFNNEEEANEYWDKWCMKGRDVPKCVLYRINWESNTTEEITRNY